MQNTYQLREKESRRKSLLLSLLFHFLLLLLLLQPCLSYFTDTENEPQITLTVMPSVIKSEVIESSSVPVSEAKSAPAALDAEQQAPAMNSSTEPAKASQKISSSSTEKSSIENGKNEKSKAIAGKKEEAGPSESEIREKKAKEESQKKENAKARFGSLFSRNNNGDNPDNPDNVPGQPNSSALESLSTAYGQTGEGLNNRNILFQPEIKDNSQKTGRVVVKICVDREGKVSSARYTQRGSTTTDAHLTELAVNNARKYRFSKGEVEEQCGEIMIDFRLK